MRDTSILLPKDIPKRLKEFVKKSKAGGYQWDQKYGRDALRIFRLFFRSLKKVMKEGDFKLAEESYKELFQLIFERDLDYYNYPDIISAIGINFDSVVENYFTCIFNNYSTKEEILEKYIEYLNIKDEALYFELSTQSMLTLDKGKLSYIIAECEKIWANLKEDDYNLSEVGDLLTEYYKSDKDKLKELIKMNPYFLTEEDLEEFF